MAIDKAVDSTILDGYFTDIADAIRANTGSQASLTPAAMPAAIAAIRPDITPFVGGYKIDYSGSNPRFVPIDLDLSGMKIIRPYFAYKGSSISPSYIGGKTLEENLLLNINTLPCLGRVVVDDSLLAIGSYAFYYQTNMDITLPDSLLQIGDNAFYGCTNLQMAALPPNLTTIGTHAFENTAVAIRELPATITSVASYAFARCAVTEMDVKCSLFSSSIFSNCSRLDHVKYRGARMPMQTFYYCNALGKVWMSEDVTDVAATSVGASPFFSCSALTDIYCEAASQPSGWGAYWNYTANDTQATVHWGVTEEEFDAIVAAA